MVEPREIAETKAPGDPAAQAFEALRGEVALLRRAMEGFAAEHRSLEIPDYSESIARITSMVSSVGKRLVAFSELPGFALSPQDFSQQILSASKTVREQDRQTIMLARDSFHQAASELTWFLSSAREAHRQDRWLVWAAGGGAVLGTLVWVFIVIPILQRLGIAFG